MPRRCTVCDSPLLVTAMTLVASGLSVRRVAKDLNLSEDAMKRHVRNGHPGTPERGAVSRAPEQADAPQGGPEGVLEVFEAAFGVAPMDWQHAYLLGARPTIVRKGRQVGATQAAAGLAIHTARSRAGADAVVISPSMRQSSEITVRARIGLDALGDRMVQDSAGLIRLKNGSRIVSLPGNSRGIRGYAPALVVVDEAAWVADDTFVAVRPLVAASKGRMVVQSTPGNPVGFFYDLATATPESWDLLVVRSTEVPTIDPDFLAKEEAEMTPQMYAQEYLAEFAETVVSAGALWTREDWEALISKPTEEP